MNHNPLPNYPKPPPPASPDAGRASRAPAVDAVPGEAVTADQALALWRLGPMSFSDFHEEVKRIVATPVAPQAVGEPVSDERIREAFMRTNTRSYDATYAAFRDGVRFAEAHYASRLATPAAPQAVGEPVVPIDAITKLKTGA